MSLVVAVAGGTGHLGTHITSALLASIPQPTVRLLTRSASSGKNFAERGVHIHVVDYKNSATVIHALQGADVFISAIGTKEAGEEVEEGLMKLALSVATIKLIISSEFGIDHRANDFEQDAWTMKRGNQNVLTSQSAVKAAFIYTGLFTEDSFGPWFGFSMKTRTFEVIGDGNALVSFTSLGDAGRAVAAVALTSLSSFPEHLYLRIAGDSASPREVAKIFADVSGESITIVEKDLKQLKELTVRDPTDSPAKFLRFLMGEGK